jgi:hypothetical protein
MKSNDSIKIVIAVVLLVIAAIVIVFTFGGGGGNDGPRGGEPVSDSDWTMPEPQEDQPESPYGVPN